MKKNIICFLLLFIFGCTVLGGCSNEPKEYQKVLSEEEIAQLQKEDYPVYYAGGSFMDIAPAPPLESTINLAPIAVLEFVEELPIVTDHYTPAPGTPEAVIADKGQMDYYTFHYYSYKFKLLETVTGEIPSYLVSEDQTITMSVPSAFADSIPQFEAGKKYVAMIGETEDSRTYTTGWFDTQCLFYVTDEEYILSTVFEKNRQKYSGYRLNDFKGILKEMERNPSELVSE